MQEPSHSRLDDDAAIVDPKVTLVEPARREQPIENPVGSGSGIRQRNFGILGPVHLSMFGQCLGDQLQRFPPGPILLLQLRSRAPVGQCNR